jgi:plastocyanin domain-containing protein
VFWLSVYGQVYGLLSLPGSTIIGLKGDGIEACDYYGVNTMSIVVERGKPVRLNFVRQESASCSDMMLFLAFSKSARLPEGETVAVEFMSKDPGEYEFAYS